MPAVQPSSAAGGGGGGGGGPGRQGAFRPPWVKEGPPALPMPSSAPWMRSRELRASRDDGQTTAVSQELQAARDRLNAVETVSTPVGGVKSDPTPVRRLSKITITPSKPSADPAVENGRPKREVHSKPSAKPAPSGNVEEAKKEPAVQHKTVKVESKPSARPEPVNKVPEPAVKNAEPKRAVQPAAPASKEKTPEAAVKSAPRERKVAVEPPLQKAVEVKSNAVPTPPPAPPAPPGPPPPPPPPGPGLNSEGPTGPKLEKIEALRSRPRKRPDWSVMMKEIETKRKLNHVVCNDRSAPLLATPIKVKEQFLYESEKPNVHNILLDQIQSGVRLKPTKTNDRSKPILDGLRKFRRQMTIEEQIQKAGAGGAGETEAAVPVEADELDDIDRVRDDLQSTKQMLALELRNREAVERDNKKLLARLLNLEVELEQERNAKLRDQTPQAEQQVAEQETRKLKTQLAQAQEAVDQAETKYHDTVGQLDLAKGELEDTQRKNQILERRLANYMANREEQPLTKQPSAKRLAAAKSNSTIVVGNQPAAADADEESEYEEETETETEGESSDEEDQEAVQERRALRELKLLTTKLSSFKDKEEMARKERVSLREQLKKLTKTLKEERKKYKVLQLEVDSMANVLKEDGSMACVLRDNDDDEDENEEEEESESESESSEESEDESDGDLPAEASSDARKMNLNKRVKQHENTLAVLKKGNYMLKTNVDRLKDDLFKQKEMAITLQEDLNSVLAELG